MSEVSPGIISTAALRRPVIIVANKKGVMGNFCGMWTKSATVIYPINQYEQQSFSSPKER